MEKIDDLNDPPKMVHRSTKGKHDGDMIVFHPQESKEIKDGKGTSRVYY